MTNRESVIAQMEVMIDIAVRDLENPANRAFLGTRSNVIDGLKQMRAQLTHVTDHTLLQELAPKLREILTASWRGLGYGIDLNRKVA